MRFSKGTLLYHGTSTDVKFLKLEGPAWFTADFRLASIFAAELGGNSGDKPRVYCYKLKKSIDLPELTQEEAMHLEVEMAGEFLGRYSAAAKEFCREHPGWVVAKLYDQYAGEIITAEDPNIDDIMICDTGILEYVGQKSIDIRHYLDYAWISKLRPAIQRAAGRPQTTLSGQIERCNNMINIIDGLARKIK